VEVRDEKIVYRVDVRVDVESWLNRSLRTDIRKMLKQVEALSRDRSACD